MIMNLTEDHIQLLSQVAHGATIYGYMDAKKLREIQQIDSELLTFVGLADLEKIHGREFDGAGQLPYFGVIATDKGIELLMEKDLY